MRFHLIDRVTYLDPWVGLKAIKMTSSTETYWDNRSGRPVMPLGFAIESICQAGSWLVIASTDVLQRAALLSIADVVPCGDIHPNDRLDIRVDVVSRGATTAVIDGSISVTGRIVLKVSSVMCSLLSVEQLDSAESTRRQLDSFLVSKKSMSLLPRKGGS